MIFAKKKNSSYHLITHYISLFGVDFNKVCDFYQIKWFWQLFVDRNPTNLNTVKMLRSHSVFTLLVGENMN